MPYVTILKLFSQIFEQFFLKTYCVFSIFLLYFSVTLKSNYAKKTKKQTNKQTKTNKQTIDIGNEILFVWTVQYTPVWTVQYYPVWTVQYDPVWTETLHLLHECTHPGFLTNLFWLFSSSTSSRFIAYDSASMRSGCVTKKTSGCVMMTSLMTSRVLPSLVRSKICRLLPFSYNNVRRTQIIHR